MRKDEDQQNYYLKERAKQSYDSSLFRKLAMLRDRSVSWGELWRRSACVPQPLPPHAGAQDPDQQFARLPVPAMQVQIPGGPNDKDTRIWRI